MDPRPVALIDICNTLADVNFQLEKALGPNPNPFNYYHPGVTESTFKNFPWLFTQAPPIKGSVEGTHQIAKNYRIVYLTARPEWARQITLEWLNRNGFPSAPVIFSKQKGEVARELKATLAIDDAPYEIISLSKIVPKMLIHQQPYNLGLAYLGEMFNWDLFQLNKVS